MLIVSKYIRCQTTSRVRPTVWLVGFALTTHAMSWLTGTSPYGVGAYPIPASPRLFSPGLAAYGLARGGDLGQVPRPVELVPRPASSSLLSNVFTVAAPQAQVPDMWSADALRWATDAAYWSRNNGSVQGGPFAGNSMAAFNVVSTDFLPVPVSPLAYAVGHGVSVYGAQPVGRLTTLATANFPSFATTLRR